MKLHYHPRQARDQQAERDPSKHVPSCDKKVSEWDCCDECGDVLANVPPQDFALEFGGALANDLGRHSDPLHGLVLPEFLHGIS
jgi:hypothetical protein